MLIIKWGKGGGEKVVSEVRGGGGWFFF